MLAGVTTTAAIAIYAALIATVGFAWQVFTWWHVRRIRVEVAACFALVGYGPEPTEMVAITATNRSEHTVQIPSFGIDLQDNSGRSLHFASGRPGSGLPGSIAPHDSATGFVEIRDIVAKGIDLYSDIHCWVRLSTGESIKAKSRIMSRS